MKEQHIKVPRTARYFLLGSFSRETKEVWIVCHGYGQLAEKFLRNFELVASKKCVVVAPEGLSRFYLNGFSGRVGASWMTRDDRLSEIEDYVEYLDRVAAEILPGDKQSSVQLTAFGFSQGVATACRWAVKGKTRIDRLILWAGDVPPDLSEQELLRLQGLRLHFVLGSRDEYASAAFLDEQKARLKAHGIEATTTLFDGGHEIDSDVLAQISGQRGVPKF